MRVLILLQHVSRKNFGDDTEGKRPTKISEEDEKDKKFRRFFDFDIKQENTPYLF